MFSFKGENVLVTGASHGIGFEIAKALSNAGITIIFNDVIKGNIKKGLATCKGNNINAHGYLFDITDEQSVKENTKKIESDVGIIDTLISNVGVTQREPMLETTAADYRKIIDISLIGQLIMAKAVLSSMIKRGYGKIINVCSMMNGLGCEITIGYALVKGGLEMLTKNICSEFGEKDIQCSDTGLGYIATSQTTPPREIQPGGSRHPSGQFIISETPAGRWGKPGDLAGAVIFSASDASSFISGHILYVDGDILAYIGKQP